MGDSEKARCPSVERNQDALLRTGLRAPWTALMVHRRQVTRPAVEDTEDSHEEWTGRQRAVSSCTNLGWRDILRWLTWNQLSCIMWKDQHLTQLWPPPALDKSPSQHIG
ncbi:histone-lysine N-methyltransferase PRDM7-like [Saccopteryx leptura]|uniref:histone-lysine N-methyltransferase PRDM7-like n=1 Tax=Saccopteryx leptura TaxID=249018 RepID=UPI00339CE790